MVNIRKEGFVESSRRDWLIRSWGILALPEILAAQDHAHHAVSSGDTTGLSHLDPATAKEIDALASRILPSDDTPGAREAGVIYFIDRALVTFDRESQGIYRTGLAEIQAKRKTLFPRSQSIAGLSEQQQDELLRSVERTEFFQTLRFHTMAGFVGNPGHGGNRNNVGWKLIGFEDKMAYAPPFGYYDRQAKEGTK
jgi:gluconate 2-dehydrogenase gamma chain